MTDSPVRELLTQLHSTLESGKPVSAADRELLRQLAADIQTALERTADGRRESLADRLRSAITRFEVSHPDLTATMARAARTLGDMGI